MKATSIKTWRFVHTWSSLIATLFLLLLCVTGLPLIFHEEIEHWGGSHESDVLPNEPVPTVDAMAARALSAIPHGRVAFVVFDREHPEVTVGVTVTEPDAGQSTWASVFDRRTGDLVITEPEGHGFMDVMLRLHTDMYAGQAGLYFLGAMGVLLAMAIVSGVVLYGPFTHKLAFGSLRAGRARRVYWLDVHNLLGIVTVTWAMVVGLTGTINTLEQPIGAFWRSSDLAAMLERHRDAPAPASLPSIDAVVAAAEAATPDMRVLSLLFPGQELAGRGHFLVVLSGTDALTARLFRTALMDGHTGRLVEAAEMPWYAQALFLSQPLHFGDYGGLPLKVIWAILDLFTIGVLGSGLYLWLARRRTLRIGTRRRRHCARGAPPARRRLSWTAGAFWRIWRTPALLAVLTLFGLVAALLGTGAWYWAAWMALSAPAVAAVWAVGTTAGSATVATGATKGADMTPLIQRLESMLVAGNDNLLLRFGLGHAYAEKQQYDKAIPHLEQAIAFDPRHSSSWFWLGRAQYEYGKLEEAERTLNQAIQVATEKGDAQTVKMAQVFLRRVKKARGVS